MGGDSVSKEDVVMADSSNGGIIRWRDLGKAVDALRQELKQETRKIEVGQHQNTDEISALRAEVAELKTKVGADVASLKTEMRILGGILLALLISIIGLFVNHIAP